MRTVYRFLLVLTFWTAAIPSAVHAQSSAGVALFSTGILSIELSSLVLHPLSLSQRFSAFQALADYQNGSGGDMYDQYTQTRSDANKLNLLSLGGHWSGLALTSSLLFLPPEQVTLSTAGKILFTGGLAAAYAGTVLAVRAQNLLVDCQDKYELYTNAGTSAGALYDTYSQQYDLYKINRIVASSLQGSGGLFTILSFLLPGRRSSITASPLQKILAGSALLLFTGGTITNYTAMDAGLELPGLYRDYTEAAGNADDFYQIYQTRYTQYGVLTVLTYGLLGTGGILLITSLFLPANTPGKEKSDAQLPEVSFIPMKDGKAAFGLSVSMR